MNGEQHEVDVIVYATGFHATEYLFPMTITGRDGQTLEEIWAEDGARAYLGCMMPGFPNLWIDLRAEHQRRPACRRPSTRSSHCYALQCMES